MKKVKVIIFCVAVFLCFAACARQKANDPSDFDIMDHGTWIEITGYRGVSNTVVIPNRINKKPVTGIGNEAFMGRREQQEQRLPGGAISIRTTYHGTLTSVIIPSSVIEIGNAAFCGNDLTDVTIPDSVTTIGTQAFMANELTSIKIPSSVKVIGDSAFRDNKLTSITIPNGVTEIGSAAFYNNQITIAIIPDSVTKIGSHAFYNNQLTNATIPNSVIEIGMMAFARNPLINFSVASGNTAFVVKDSFLLSKDEKQLLFNFGSDSNVIIPDSVNVIFSNAFSGRKLESVTIPSSVGRINFTTFDCSHLKSITFEGNIELSGMWTDTPGGRSFMNLRQAFRGPGKYLQSSGVWRRE